MKPAGADTRGPGDRDDLDRPAGKRSASPRGQSNGLWESYFQQDASYPGRRNPNLAIYEFFNRLDRHGGPDSPDIWKSIFWLQQRPGDPSADIAFARGRQGYITEIPSQLPRARALYREITCTEGASNFILGAGAAERVAHAEIVREVRKGKAPSDHAPVLVDISTNWS